MIDTVEKILVAIILTVCFMFSVFGIAIAVDNQKQMQLLEKRVLVLETRVNIYSGYGGKCDN